MSLNTVAIFNAVKSHAQTLGIFDRVAGAEPKNAPGNGLTCAIWINDIAPAAAASGLNAASGRVSVNLRIYKPMLTMPQDGIDIDILSAVDQLYASYAGGFTLGGLIRNVDVFGALGPALSAKAGYLNQDGKLFRVMDVIVPMIISDLWDEVP